MNPHSERAFQRFLEKGRAMIRSFSSIAMRELSEDELGLISGGDCSVSCSHGQAQCTQQGNNPPECTCVESGASLTITC